MRNQTLCTHRRLLSCLLSGSLLYTANASIAHGDDFFELSLEQLGEVRVTNIATGTDTPLDKAAAVVSVITEEDIEAIGARDITEVLETIPGLHVSVHPIDYTPKYNIRGITSAYTAQTLIMINSVPISSLYVGSPSLVWAGMPVKAIKKIEVIRGPGSALYGADAFAGVINISTKGGKDISKTELGYSQGSFDSYGGWINYGESLGELNFGLTLEYNETDGFKETVVADTQSGFDALTGTNASLAPGDTNTGKESIDLRTEVSHEDWVVRVGYQGRDNVESGLGVAESLSPSARFSSDRFNIDFSHFYKDIEQVKLTTRASYYYNDQQVEEDNLLFPAGSNVFFPFGGTPAYPDGVVGNPEYREEQARLNIDAEITKFDEHIVRMGLGYFWGDIYETTEQKNFEGILSPRPGGVEEVADQPDDIFLPEKDRTNFSVYLQDEWLFSQNWALTAGVRYDDYSDIGDTLNPRFALVWATTNHITTKFLYGRAFRAPTINELFVTSNPVSLGDENLDPEKIDTYELALNHRVNDVFQYSANTYYYKIKDLISLVSTTGLERQWQNTNDRTGYGFELEGKLKVSDNLALISNLSYQQSKDDENNQHVGETPGMQIYARLDWKRDKTLTSLQINHVGDQRRAPGDNRDELGSYTTVDLTLRQKEIFSNLDISLLLKNVFDEEVFEPSLGSPVNVPNDYPMARRSVYGEISYSF